MYNIEDINGESFLLELCRQAEKSCVLKADNMDGLLKWRENARKRVLSALGTDRLVRDGGSAQLVESVSFDGYRRDKYILPTAVKLKMPLYVLVPNNCNGKTVIALHCHGSYGKEGAVGNPPEGARDNTKAAYGLELVQRGYIAVCPDILGSGERMTQLCKNLLQSACDILNDTLSALGLSLQGAALFELMVLTDFALGLKENKFDKAASLGFSGGGLFSLLMAGLCDNIDVSVVSGYFHTQKDTCLQSNKCGCNFVYNMWKTADCGELAAMAAPKPLYIECGSDDKLHGRSGLDSVYAELETAKKAYSIYDKEENLQLAVCEGAHRWYGSCYDFLHKACGL